MAPPTNVTVPQTPIHSKVPPADEMPVVGHGDKVKREAGELVEDVKVEREERRHRRDDEKYERYV
jgi:RNA-binding protein Luc7-like 2